MDQPSSRNCPLAMVSLVLGMLVCVTCGLTAIPAIVCGHLALRRIRRDALHGKALAIIGLVLGYSCLLLVLFHVVLLSAISCFIIGAAPDKDVDREVSVQEIEVKSLDEFFPEEGSPSAEDESLLFNKFNWLSRDLRGMPMTSEGEVDAILALYRKFLEENREFSDDVIYRRAQENMQAIEDLKAFYRPGDAPEGQ